MGIAAGRGGGGWGAGGRGGIIGYEHKTVTNAVSLRSWWYIGFEVNCGVKSNEAKSYQNGECNSPIFSTQRTYALQMC